MTDPAQSAPSAELPTDLQKEARELMGLLKLDVTGGQILFSALSRLQKAATLRTAQLERERNEFERECENRLQAVNTYVRLLSKEVGLRQAAETRAETAESALGHSENLLALYRAKRESDGGPGRVWDSGKHLIAEEAIAKAEAVAAQTPQVSNEKENENGNPV